EELGAIFQRGGRFVSSHPMAGSEQAGICAARADLFDGAICILTPAVDAPEEDVLAITGFWEEIGCRVRRLSAEEHDEAVALVSHFPHLLAAVLVHCVQTQNSAAFEFAGPGFRDVTRVAKGPPGMWAEILRSNAGAVRKSTEAMIEK